VTALGLRPGGYATAICRPIPENSLLEIVTAWSRQRRDMPLVVLGNFTREDEYHRSVLDAAGDEVRFPGAIYDPEVVGALRFHSAAYLHGHTVGGTNPSLVEAMAAHNAVIAHDNPYNRWVAGPQARYFQDADSLSRTLDEVLPDASARERMGRASYRRFEEEFTWEHIGGQYEEALLRSMRRRRPAARPDDSSKPVERFLS
jgi:glycosyltransferase involved in cell wall biosynthesis